MTLRVLLAAAIVVLWPFAASAREQINEFLVDIDVAKDGDILVSETIDVTVEGDEIKRGIFRDLPRYYERDGLRYAYEYDILRVERDGAREPYETDREGNALQIRIGDPDVFLDLGAHRYVIEYEVKNQVRYFDAYDEIYWNATGNYWSFRIAGARVAVRLPDGAPASQTAAYTGGQGESGGAYRYTFENGAHVFQTTRSLLRGEGLTIAVGFEKGLVDPLSTGDLRGEWLQRNASGLALGGAVALLSLFYGWSFVRVGQDPAKGPVFPRYEPPAGLSPAGVHHIYHRALSGHQALIATILNLGIKDALKIETQSKKKTKLTLLSESAENAAPEERNLLQGIFKNRDSFTLGDGTDKIFTSAYLSFQVEAAKKFGKPYFRWNTGFLVLGIILVVVAIIAAATLSIDWTVWHTAGVVLLAVMTAAFSYFIPAPTPKGQATRTEIEGFRLYLKTAEKIYLDAVKVGSGAPPPMTVERYERFLPYAAALGVEEPWTRHFEKLIPEEAANYQPRWVNAHGARYTSLHGLNQALVAGMASGVASSLPQSSSSSGSGGGGFSGGGGGGGGW